jgi:hypothetical protein
MGGFKEGELVGTAPDASYYLFVTEDVSSETHRGIIRLKWPRRLID